MTARDEDDEVDAIISAWHRERPDVDLSPMEVLSRLTRLARQLDRIRKQSFASHGLETWEWDVLAALRRAGSPFELSPGQLVGATMVTSGTMTNRVDRLVERGFVRRRPAPSDRRGVLVRLTPAGVTVVDAGLDTLLECESALLADLPMADRDAVAASLRVLTTRIRS